MGQRYLGMNYRRLKPGIILGAIRVDEFYGDSPVTGLASLQYSHPEWDSTLGKKARNPAASPRLRPRDILRDAGSSVRPTRQFCQRSQFDVKCQYA